MDPYRFYELAKVREKLVRDAAVAESEIAYPFTGYIGPNAPGEHVKILYVGKATRGKAGEAANFEKQQEWAGEVVKGLIRGNSAVGDEDGFRLSPFWSHLVHLFYAINGQPTYSVEDEQCRAHALTRVGWTNLAKVGVIRGNPEGGVFEAQRALCQVCLKEEIEQFSPAIVVIVSGNYHGDFVEEVFLNEHGWDKTGSSIGIWAISIREGQTRVYWSDHPQGKSASMLRAWRSFIVEDFYLKRHEQMGSE